jgi:MoaA/NifB/PqqE/SkfB family radical SAM enzyme
VLSEEAREDGVQDGKVEEHEEAAHDKRNWVRLTYDCNDRCIFCLDSQTHDGTLRDLGEIKEQILDGARKGATRLILSGGEPTIHPRYVDFIKLGRLAGYRKIQTVTNGRMFAYKEFITRCIDAGLGEITFSIHGPNARVHDALVGVKGAFDQEVQGLRHALDDGRVIVNIDVCVNRGNVKVLPELIRTFVAMGVREYDLLHVIPFGRAYEEGKDTLFYDLEEAAPYLREAFAWSREPDMHIWLNRFPPEHLEGFEDLIQDPYKLNDEVRGRKEEYEELLASGTPLDCRDPERCKYCYLERLCDTLDEVRATVHEERFDAVRVDATWESRVGPVYGGDPASARRAKDRAAEEAAEASEERPRVRLPLATEPAPLPIVPVTERARRAGAHTVISIAPTLTAALTAAEPFDGATALELELDDYTGLAASLDGGRLGRFTLVRAVAHDTAQARELLAIDAPFEVVVLVTRETEPLVRSFDPFPARLVLRQPTYERVTDAKALDVDLPAFFASIPASVPVEGVPACILGRPPRPRPETLDTAMTRPDGRLEIFRYAKRFILDRYLVKSLRCRTCAHYSTCRGMHVNQIRAHGFGFMTPVPRDDAAAAE